MPRRPVILFLDDHGDQGYFSLSRCILLYQVIMQHQTNKFLIFIDSRFSGSFIDIVHWYNRIHEINDAKGNGKINTIALFSFYNLFETIFQFQTKNIERAIKTARTIIQFFQNKVQVPSSEIFTILFNTAIDYFQKGCDKSLNLYKEFHVSSDDYTKMLIKKSGVTNLQELLYFYQVITSIHHEKITFHHTYQNCVAYFTEANLDLFIDFSDNNFDSFYKVLSLFVEYKDISFHLPPHPNIEIITSADSESKSLAFSSISVNEFAGVYTGTPAMGAFIKEVFMNPENDQINFSNIERDIKPQSTENIQLKPQHYISGVPFKKISNKEILGHVSVLRILTYSVSKQLKEYAMRLSPDAKFDAEQTHDMFADIVAVAAVLHFSQLDEFNAVHYKKLGFDSLEFIVKTAIEISDDPIRLTAVAVNILQRVTKKDFAIVAKLTEEAYGFALLLAGIIIKEKPVKELIQELDKMIRTKRNNFDIFLEEVEKAGDDESIIQKKVEDHIIAFCKSASASIESESKANGIADAFCQIEHKDERTSALKALVAISKMASEKETAQTEDILMKSAFWGCFDKSFSIVVLAEMPAETAIKALLIATNSQRQRAYDILNGTGLNDIAANVLNSNWTPKDIEEEAKSISKKLTSTMEKTEKETKLNIEKRIPSGVEEKIETVIKNINSMDVGGLKNINSYLSASSDRLRSLSKFEDTDTRYSPGFVNSSANPIDIFERAAKEMLYVAELLNIWSPELEEAIAENAKDVYEYTINDTLLRTMVARSMGVAETAPIAEIVHGGTLGFLKKPETVNPSTDEIMALISGVKHILRKKDKNGNRFREPDIGIGVKVPQKPPNPNPHPQLLFPSIPKEETPISKPSGLPKRFTVQMKDH